MYSTVKYRVTFFCFSVQARTYYGARHGLETLSQMIAFDESSEFLTIYSTAQVRPYMYFFREQNTIIYLYHN